MLVTESQVYALGLGVRLYCDLKADSVYVCCWPEVTNFVLPCSNILNDNKDT